MTLTWRLAVEIDHDDLIGARAVTAGAEALAQRNRAHLQGMDQGERDDAIAHWHELAVEVLSAAHRALGGSESAVEGGGRAVIVVEDAGPEDVAVSATFVPQLEELPGDQVRGTPAQLAALQLLESLAGEDE